MPIMTGGSCAVSPSSGWSQTSGVATAGRYLATSVPGSTSVHPRPESAVAGLPAALKEAGRRRPNGGLCRDEPPAGQRRPDPSSTAAGSRVQRSVSPREGELLQHGDLRSRSGAAHGQVGGRSCRNGRQRSCRGSHTWTFAPGNRRAVRRPSPRDPACRPTTVGARATAERATSRVPPG